MHPIDTIVFIPFKKGGVSLGPIMERRKKQERVPVAPSLPSPGKEWHSTQADMIAAI